MVTRHRNKIVCLAILLASFGSAWAQKADNKSGKKVRVVYPKNTRLQFEGLNVEGELKNPGEFYFQHRRQEKFDSLLERRKNFQREMLRDVVMSR